MDGLIDKQIVLSLNRLWQPIGFLTVKKTFGDLCSENPKTGEPPKLAMDLTYEQNEDGTYNTDILLNARPVEIEEWLSLPVRNCDLGIMCSRRLVRVPTIVICRAYASIPEMTPKFSSQGIWERDNYTCQASGKKLKPGEGDLAHDVASANGGQRSWTNIALLDKNLNRMQGTKTFKEMGWNIKPKAPKARRIYISLNESRDVSHAHFLK